MRYRRISYRFAEVMTGTGVRLLGDPWAVLPRMVIARPQWRPAADLYETPSAFVVKVELPGVSEDQIDITVYEDALVVEGARHCESPGNARYHGAEIRYGPFRLEVSLPSAIDRDQVTARYEGGFLCASLPKIDRSRP
jgi:HSP20 family molecular chaperone IbpA